MKVKPYTYLQGGSLFLPVNVQLERANPHYGGMLAKGDDETGGTSGRSGASGGSKSKSDEDGLLSLLKSFEKDLLPNEAEAFYSELIKLLRHLDVTGQPLTASILLLLKSKLPRMVHNHAEANKARDNMFAKGVQDEYAISAEGALYNMKKDGTIEMVSLPSFNPEKHTGILTNGELLHLREYSPLLVNDVGTITSVNNGQSAQLVVEFIDKVLAAAQKSETKEEFTTNIKVLQPLASLGISQPQLDALMGLAGAGLTGEQLVNYAHSTNNPAVESALSYIYKIMPRPMLYYLQAKSMVDNGMTYKEVSSNKMFDKLLLDAAGTYQKEDLSVTADSTKTGAANTGGSGAKVTPTATVAFFHRVLPRQFALTDSSYNTSLDIVAPASMGMLLDTKDLNAMTGPMTISVALDGGNPGKGTGWGRYCLKENIWVGGMKLPYEMLNTIVYDNTEAAQVALPTKNGELDTELLKKISQAFNDYKKNHNKSSLDATDKLLALKESFVSGVYVNPTNGAIQYEGDKDEFLVVYGYLNDDDDSDQGIKYDEHLSDIRYYKKLEGAEKTIAKGKIDNAEGYEGGDVDWYDSVYKAPIFIKLSPNYSSLVEYDAKTVKENPLDEHTLDIHDLRHQKALLGAGHSSSRLSNK